MILAQIHTHCHTNILKQQMDSIMTQIHTHFFTKI